YTRCVLPSSNERNALYLNVAAEGIGSRAYDDTLVHELQHLIHWTVHPQGDAWANEGMSVYAEYRAGYNVSQLADAFLKHPDTQLTDWSDRGEQVLAHYGAAFLFFAFLQQHYGTAHTFRQLLSLPESNWAMIQTYLQQYHTTANAVFEQWAIANLLDNRQVAHGLAAYRALPHPIAPTAIQPLGKDVQGNVVPYGTRYYSLSPIDRTASLHFHGATTTTLLPASAGSAIGWWSNHGDLMDTTLTRTLDLRGVTHAHLHYQLWLDIEHNYDFLYVEVSTDGGHHWILIPATHTTTVNSTGNNLGAGYTGKSVATSQGTPGWWSETADLTPFAGKTIELRFEYITDEEYSGPGAAIRDIRIPALGISNDGTSGAWRGQGWLYVPNRVAARFHVTLIAEGDHTTVSTLPLDAQNRGTFALSQLPSGTRRLLVAVSTFALKTTQPVAYTLSIVHYHRTDSLGSSSRSTFSPR
ncbi:MAG: immune inhibitor A, partial [Chloroflexi bacterium]|nr:immune inhibitor A [Chloroflexota bacterium]